MGNKQSNVEEATAAEATAAEATSNEDKKRRSDFPDDEIQTSSVKYQKVRVIAPTNLILLAVAHSDIPLVTNMGTGEKKLPECTIPAKFSSILKINLAPPGVTSCMSAMEEADFEKFARSPKGYDDMPRMIKMGDNTSYKHLILRTMDSLNAETDLNKIFDILRSLQTDTKGIYESSVFDPLSKDKFKEEQATIEKAVNLHFFTHGPRLDQQPLEEENIYLHLFPDGESMKMVNKTYECSSTSPDPCNHAIIALNIDNLPLHDLFPLIAGPFVRGKPRKITTEELLKFIAENRDPDVDFSNVENVIIFDTGCAPFSSRDHLTEDAKEELKEETTRMGFGGSKRSKKIIKKKNKKTKKYKRKTRNTRKYKRK